MKRRRNKNSKYMIIIIVNMCSSVPAMYKRKIVTKIYIITAHLLTSTFLWNQATSFWGVSRPLSDENFSFNSFPLVSHNFFHSVESDSHCLFNWSDSEKPSIAENRYYDITYVLGLWMWSLLPFKSKRLVNTGGHHWTKLKLRSRPISLNCEQGPTVKYK